jgi:class III poly(R)-hydroxyalkanoic acid synthase PhaE subunit
MTWSKQADSMMNVWTEAQKKMWESWYQTTQQMSGTNMSGMGMYDQWQQMAANWLETFTANAEPTAKNVSRQMVASQATMMRFLEMTTKAWSSMIPKLEQGQQWDTVLNDYMEQFRKQLLDPAAMMQATQSGTTMWQTYFQQMQTMMKPWSTPMMQTPMLMGTAFAGEGSGSIIELTRMYWDAYNKTAGQFVGMPGVGFTREIEETFAKGYAAWTNARQAMDEYQLLINEAWSGVMEEVLKDMMTRAEKGTPITTVRDLIKLWTGAADRSFDTVFRSDKYAEVQGKFVSTYMEYRVSEQAMMEAMLKYTHFPTRGEVDEAHRNIYELRKEVKLLKKAMKILTTTPKSSTTPPAKNEPAKPASTPKKDAEPTTGKA